MALAKLLPWRALRPFASPFCAVPSPSEDIRRRVYAPLPDGSPDVHLMGRLVGALTGTLWCVIPAAIYARWLTGEGQKKRQSVWSRFTQRMGFGREIRVCPVS